MGHVLSILFGAAFTICLIWSLGRLLFARLHIELPGVEHDLLATTTGGALLSLSVFLLCAANAARTPVFLAAGMVGIALNWRYGGKSAGSLPGLPAPWKWLFLVPFAIYGVLYLSNSLAPEVSPDGQVYHLGLVYRYFREHGFHRVTDNMYASLAQGVEMLFLVAFAFGRHSAAATVHCCYLLALPVLMLSYARRIGRPKAGVCAAMLTYLSPLVAIDGISAYNDVALATTAFAVFYLLEIWREDDTQNALLIPVGLLAGFCFAIKITGIVAIFYAAVVILMRKRPRALMPVIVAAAVIALPWVIKNWLWLGNPVAPFLNRVFPNPFVHVLSEEALRTYTRHYELRSFWQWPWAVTTGGDLAGPLGPWFLLAPLALFSLRSAVGRRCLLPVFVFAVLYPQNIDARFLVPAIPFVALAMALALEAFQPALVGLTAIAAILALPPVIDSYRGQAGSWHIRQMPVRAALRIVPQDLFLAQRSIAWINARTLDYFVPAGKRVWTSTPVAEAYTSTDVTLGYFSAEGDLVADILATAVRAELLPTWNLRFTFRRQQFQHLRLVQTATGSGVDETWSIGEVRILDGEHEILPTQAWKVEADPYPWDIWFAFDANPVTRWRSWRTYRPGMHVDVEFGRRLAIDRVEVLSSHDQPNIDVHPEICDGPVCTILKADLDKLDTPPPGDLRKLSTQTVKRRGFDFLMIDDGNWTAEDMRKNTPAWGLELITERAGNRLYRIQ